MAVSRGAQSLNAAIYRGVGLHPNLLRLDAGRMFEKVVSPAMNLLQARPQVPITVANRIAARADWVLQGRHVVDAKFGQYVNFGQLTHFVEFAARNGGSVTYVTLTRTPQALIDRAVQMGQAQQVSVNFISLLPF